MNPAPPFPPPMPQPPPPGWWSKNWKWCVPVAAASLLAFFLVFVCIISLGVRGLMRSSEPYKKAVNTAVANPELRSKLGIPIKVGPSMKGTVASTGSSGQAYLAIPISGPKGKANIHVDAKKTSGVWTYSTLEATIDGKPDKIDLSP